MGKNIHTKVLIIGGGAAGMSAALSLQSDDAILLESPGSNSIFSPWNIMVKQGEELKKDMLKAGNEKNNKKILNQFIKRNQEIVEDLKFFGIPLRKSNIGLVPTFRSPGLEIKKILNQEIKNKGVKILNGQTEAFLVDKNNAVKGIVAKIGGKKTNILFDYLILAAGGVSSFFNFSTGEKTVNGSILSLCWENGFELENMEFFMFHPFLLVDKRLPRMLISGDILTKMVFKNEKGGRFISKKIEEALKNNKHHSIFPEMIREFYEESLKGKIFAELDCSSDWFENYKKENEFGYIFQKYILSDLGTIEIHPAFHFSIGGLKINEKAQTIKKNVYAAGEIASGLHGNNRIGGTAVSEAWIFGKIAAEDINKKLAKIKNGNSRLPTKSLRKIGSIGLSFKIKEKIWDALGPVRNKNSLLEFIDYIGKVFAPTSEERFAGKIAEISLRRKESAGVFYRDDLQVAEKSKNSLLKNHKIIFK